ncbi:hypothetical protein EV1_000081 [Malus domestica]
MCSSQMATSRILCLAIRDKYGVCQIEFHLTLPSFDSVIAERSSLSQRLDELLSQEETFWCQRYRVLWLKGGDLNTKFFHRRACNRQAKNKIKGLTNTHGKTSKSGEVIVTIDRRVTTDMNAHLKQNFTNEEIREAIFQMHLSKSPSSDGMPPLFFQKYWEIVGSDVTHAIKSFLKSGKLLKQIHFTPVALIPKVHEPKYMSNMRLISLCNVLFKIASKALANKLKAFLPHIISHHQSAFVP